MRWTISALVCAVISFGGASSVAVAEELPVWWSPTLEVESLDKVEERLLRKFHVHGQIEAKRVRSNGTEETALMDSCAATLRLVGEGFQGTPYSLQLAILAECQAIELLAKMQPATQSFVQNFVLDETAPDFLPAMLDLGSSCDWACRLHIANEYRIPWREMGTIEKVESKSEHSIRITTDWSLNTVELLARADFNGDGLEDILVRAGGRARGGTLSATSLYLLSRDTDDSVFFVLGSEAHLCPTYTCDRQYSNPSVIRDLEQP